MLRLESCWNIAGRYGTFNKVVRFYQKFMFMRFYIYESEVMLSAITLFSSYGTIGILRIDVSCAKTLRLASFWRSNTVVMFIELRALLSCSKL
jgi:hypothetical protein